MQDEEIIDYWNRNKKFNKKQKGLWGFLRTRKKWWLVPLLILIGFVLILIFFSGYEVLPFIYG